MSHLVGTISKQNAFVSVTYQALNPVFGILFLSVQHGLLPLQHLILPVPKIHIHRASMDTLQPLGKGAFGSVVAVRSRLDRRLLAVKQVRDRV